MNGRKEGWRRVGSRTDSPRTYLKDNDCRRRNGAQSGTQGKAQGEIEG